MAGPIKISILANAQPAVAGMHQVEESARGMGSKLGGIGSSIKGVFAGLGAAFAVDKIAEGFKTVVDEAASLSAAIGTTKSIFGSSANDMIAWGKTASTTLGLSQSEALNATKVFGGFFTGVGMGTKEAAGMSKNWTTMAANMAAFGDIPVAESLDAVKSALIGEYDPIQKLIPTISAASLQQKAMELSGKKNAKALTDQDKAAALNAIMMDSMANKVGAAERKQGGYAVQMDKLKAQMKNAAGAIGSVFLPALTGAMSFINDTAFPAVKKFGDFIGPKLKSAFGGFQPPKALQDSIESIKALGRSKEATSIVDNIKEGVAGFPSLFARASTVIGPIFGQIGDTARNLFVKALPQIKATIGTISSIVSSALELIRTVFGYTVNIIQFVWQNFGANILSYISTAFSSVVNVIQGALNVVKGVFDVVIGLLTGDWAQAWAGVKGIVSGAWQAILGIFNLAKAGIGLILSAIGKVLTGAWVAIKIAAAFYWNALKDAVLAVWNALKSAIGSAVSALGSLVASGWNAVKSATIAAWNSVKSATIAAWNAVKEFIASSVRGWKIIITSAASAVMGAITSIWNSVKSATSTAWNAVKTAVITGVTNVVGAVRAMPGKIKSAISNAATWLVSVGRDIVQGMINGVGQMVGALVDKVKGLAGSAIKAATGVLDSNSPSKVFMQIGRDIVAGLNVGIDTSKDSLIKTTKDLADSVIKAFPTSIKKTFAKGTKLSAIEAWKKNEIAAGKTRGKKRNALLDKIAAENTKLQELAARRDTVAEKLKAATDDIAQMQEQRANVVTSVAGAITSSFKLVADAGDRGVSTIDGMLERARAALEQAPEFAELMQKLAARGAITPEVLKQLAEAGPAAGLETARALAQASSAELAEMNKAYAASAVTIDNILTRSRDALAQAQQFSTGLKDLAGRGLSPQLLQELATAGPQAGMETMKALTAASADQLAELNKNYADIAATGQAAGEVVAGHMYDTGIAMAQKAAEGFASQQAYLEASILQMLDSLTKKINVAVGNVAPKIQPVEVKGSLTSAKKKVKVGKAYKEIDTGATGGAVTVTINTGAIVDKRGMVDTISTAFNEVSGQLGRPISMNVA